MSVVRTTNEGAGDGEIDLGGVSSAFRRARGWIAGVTLLSLAGSVAFVSLVKPRYTAEAKALVENQENYFTRPDRAPGSESTVAPDPEAVASQVQLVTSRDLSREAIKLLGLKGNEEFDPAAGIPGILSSLRALFGSARESRDLAPEDRIFPNYSDKLFVFPIVKSRVLQIEFTSWDPDLAAKAANTIADLYVGLQSKTKRENARIAAASLANLTTDLRARVGEAERKADEFRASNGLSIGANNLTLNNQQMSDLNGQLTLARTAQADAQAKSRLIRDMLRQGRINEVPDVANNDLIRRLSEQRATLRGQVASETRTLLPGHPRVKELTAQLVELENNLRTAADKAARTLENDARLAGSRVENLRAALEQQKQTLGGASGDESRAKELDREARLLKDQLEASTVKYQEALARQIAESTPSDARIISRAVAPQLPTFPKKAPIVAFATLAGLILSMGGVLAGELLSGRAYSAARASQRLEPSMQQIPGADQAFQPAAEGGNSASSAPANPIRVALAGVAATLAHRPRRAGGTRVLVTSAGPGADAAAMAVTIGREIALSQRVVLVETSMGAGQEGPQGLSDIIAGVADFETAIHKDSKSSLHLLPAGQRGGGHMAGLDPVVDALALAYDQVILLVEPVGAGAYALALAPDADTALVIYREGEDASAQRVCDQLRHAGAREVMAIAQAAPAPQVSEQQNAA